MRFRNGFSASLNRILDSPTKKQDLQSIGSDILRRTRICPGPLSAGVVILTAMARIKRRWRWAP